MTPSDDTDPRAVWLRSLGWSESATGMWSGRVIATKGRYRPMSLERAFDVALKRSVTDKQFAAEVSGGRVRLASSWRDVVTTTPDDKSQPESVAAAYLRARDERPDVLRQEGHEPEDCVHAGVVPTVELHLVSLAQTPRSERGTCLACGERVTRLQRAGAWSPWLLDSAA